MLSNLVSQASLNRGAKNNYGQKRKHQDWLTIQFYMSFVISGSIYSGFSCFRIELAIAPLGFLKAQDTIAKVNITGYGNC